MTELPPSLSDALGRHERVRGRVALLRGAAEATAVGLTGLGAAAAIDALVHPGNGARTAMTIAVWTGTAAVLAWRGVAPWLRQADAVANARTLEAAAGLAGEEPLSGPVSLARSTPPGTSPWMVSRALTIAAQVATTLPVEALIERRPLHRRLLLSGALASLALGGLLVPGGAELLMRAAWPWAQIARPSSVHLSVTPGNRRVPEGSALAITAQVTPQAERVEAVLHWEGADEEVLPLQAVTGPDGRTMWRTELPAVVRPFTYAVRAGGGESPTYQIRVARPLRIATVGLELTPPSYTGLPVRRLDGGDAAIVAGTRVRLRATIEGPVSSATALVDGAETPAVITDGAAVLELTPASTTVIALRLVDGEGLAADAPQRWTLKVVPDAPPTVSLAIAGFDTAQAAVGRDELLAAITTASDDLGLASLALEVLHDGDSDPTLISQPLPADGRPAEPLALTLDLAPFGLAPGEGLTLTAIATDRGGQVTRSAPLKAVVAGQGAAALMAAVKRLRTIQDTLANAARTSETMATAWGSLAGRPGDDLSRRAEVAMLATRAGAWTTALEQAAAELSAVAKTLPESTGAARDQLARSAAGLGAWVPRIGRPLTTTTDIATGHQAAEAAANELESWRKAVDLGAARVEATRLQLAAQADAQRATRCALLLRGDAAWRGEAVEAVGDGLAGTWFAGLEPTGTPIGRAIGVPVAPIALANVPAENYSARWTGDIRIPTAGKWTFTVTVDDGARLSIDGKELFVGKAWKMQAPTPYSETVELAAGWHPIDLAFNQGGGGAFLSLGLAPEGAPPRLVTNADLRSGAETGTGTGAGTIDPQVVAAMAAAAPGTIVSARTGIAAAAKGLAEIPPGIAGLAQPSGLEQIANAAKPHLAAAASLGASSATADTWSAGEAGLVVESARVWNELATQTVRWLEEACAKQPEQQDPTTSAGLILSDLAAAKQHLERARTEAEAGNQRRTDAGLAAARNALARAEAEVAANQAELDARVAARALDPVAAQQPAERKQAERDRQAAERLTALTSSLATSLAQAAKAKAEPGDDPLHRRALDELRSKANNQIETAKALARLDQATDASKPRLAATTAPAATVAEAQATVEAAQTRATALAAAEDNARDELTTALAAQTAALAEARAAAEAIPSAAAQPAAALVATAVVAAKAAADQAVQSAASAAQQRAEADQATQTKVAAEEAAATAKLAAAALVAAQMAPSAAAAKQAEEAARAEARARVQAGDQAGADAAAQRAEQLAAGAKALADARTAAAADQARKQAANAAQASASPVPDAEAATPPAGATPEQTAQAAQVQAERAAHTEAARAAAATSAAAAQALAAQLDGQKTDAALTTSEQRAAAAAATAQQTQAVAAAKATAAAAGKAAADDQGSQASAAAAKAAESANQAVAEIEALALRTAESSVFRAQAGERRAALVAGAAELRAAAERGGDAAQAGERQAAVAHAAERLQAGTAALPDPDRPLNDALTTAAAAADKAAAALAARQIEAPALANDAVAVAGREWAQPLARAALAQSPGAARDQAVAQGRAAVAATARTQAASERLARISADRSSAEQGAALALTQQTAAAAQAEQTANDAATSSPPPAGAQAGNQPDASAPPGGSTPGEAAAALERAIKAGDWARLSEPARQAILAGGQERFAPEQRAAISAYLQRLGEDR